MRYYIIKHDILISGDTFPTAMLCLPSEQCTSILIHKIQFYRLNITSDCLSMLKGSFFPYFFPPEVNIQCQILFCAKTFII